jgi:hypothetical protein
LAIVKNRSHSHKQPATQVDIFCPSLNRHLTFLRRCRS